MSRVFDVLASASVPAVSRAETNSRRTRSFNSPAPCGEVTPRCDRWWWPAPVRLQFEAISSVVFSGTGGPSTKQTFTGDVRIRSRLQIVERLSETAIMEISNVMSGSSDPLLPLPRLSS